VGSAAASHPGGEAGCAAGGAGSSPMSPRGAPGVPPNLDAMGPCGAGRAQRSRRCIGSGSSRSLACAGAIKFGGPEPELVDPAGHSTAPRFVAPRMTLATRCRFREHRLRKRSLGQMRRRCQRRCSISKDCRRRTPAKLIDHATELRRRAEIRSRNGCSSSADSFSHLFPAIQRSVG
jgi:hypothetical protein